MLRSIDLPFQLGCFAIPGETETASAHLANHSQPKNKKGAAKLLPLRPPSRRVESHPNPVRIRSRFNLPRFFQSSHDNLPPLLDPAAADSVTGPPSNPICLRSITRSAPLLPTGLRLSSLALRAEQAVLIRCLRRSRILFPVALNSREGDKRRFKGRTAQVRLGATGPPIGFDASLFVKPPRFAG